MNSSINQIYLQLNETFNSLLNLRERDELEGCMQKFRESIFLLEGLPDTDLACSLKNNQDLIIKVFQFKTMAQDRIWSDMPKVRSHIATLISDPVPYEVEFRGEVERFGWGEFLDYIKD